MKKVISCFIIMICLVTLYGCNKDKPSNSQEEVLEQGGEEIEDGEEIEGGSKTGSTEEETVYSPITGDNITVAIEFARDLSEENFDKLMEAYQYDANMQTAIGAEETIKAVIYYNSEYGEIKDIKDTYTLAVGAYQYVVIPIEASNSSFNYQIAFDGKQNIIGFTYSTYEEREPAVVEAMPDNIEELPYTFTSDGYDISGTLTTPKDLSAWDLSHKGAPVVILVHGSGASDRDESIYENKPFRDIAWALAQKGIASFRYDKRNYLYGEQMFEDKEITIYDETIHDATAAVKMVKDIEGIDSSQIFVLGHSLGGYVIPRIAEELTDAAGYIMMAAPAQHLKEYIISQYEYLSKEDGVVTNEEKNLIKQIREQVLLLDKPEDIPANQIVLGAYKDYWIDLNSYDPLGTAAKINLPVLVLQGKRDYQVTMDQYDMWKNEFALSDNWTFHAYGTLNHLMMAGVGMSGSEEYKTKAYVDDIVIQDIIDFIFIISNPTE